MKAVCALTCVATAALVTGCAGSVSFYDAQGNPIYKQYCEPVSYIVKTTDAQCKTTDQLVSLSGETRYLKLKPGFGSSNLSVGFSGCLITQVGQSTDREIPQTISALASLGTSVSGAVRANELVQLPGQRVPPVQDCKPEQAFYRLPFKPGASSPDFTIVGVGSPIAIAAPSTSSDVAKPGGPKKVKPN